LHYDDGGQVPQSLEAARGPPLLAGMPGSAPLVTAGCPAQCRAARPLRLSALAKVAGRTTANRAALTGHFARPTGCWLKATEWFAHSAVPHASL
jgi:hypothetical protein